MDSETITIEVTKENIADIAKISLSEENQLKQEKAEAQEIVDRCNEELATLRKK